MAMPLHCVCVCVRLIASEMKETANICKLHQYREPNLNGKEQEIGGKRITFL